MAEPLQEIKAAEKAIAISKTSSFFMVKLDFVNRNAINIIKF
jgi:hypothetical protein